MRVPLFLLAVFTLDAKMLPVQKGPLHLRSGVEREWNEFPEKASARALKQSFIASANTVQHTLSLRQRDVKYAKWLVRLNGRTLGTLIADERDMRPAFPIPAGVLHTGSNLLEIAAADGGVSDDIELRDIRIYPVPVEERHSEAVLKVDAGVDPEAKWLPLRITIVDHEGVLVPFAARGPSEREAVRTGVVYSIDGRTEIGLPAGKYRVYASRGWEYSSPSRKVPLLRGKSHSVQLRARREVNLPGYISCDTHVHTLELSGHGDADVRERIITAAGEGLDMFVATEHNKAADYSSTLRRLGLQNILTIVSGNEVTTAIGHFNIFPVSFGRPVPDARQRDWDAISQSVQSDPAVRVIVQNHPRDLHSAYRPFDPRHHLASTGQNLIGRLTFANAMEVVNSGAMYSDIMRPVLDWLGLLNRGLRVSAVGASDTHTVDFVPIGQARTMIEVGQAGAGAAPERLAAGENLVSYGLAADLQHSGTTVKVQVYGPSWASADRLVVYANGKVIADRRIPPSKAPGLKWSDRIRVGGLRHDTTLVAAVTGPGVRLPFWEVRKPYQPVTKDWTPRIIGISKAVRVDADGGGFQSPWDYARALLRRYPDPSSELMPALSAYDQSVTMQVLSILTQAGTAPEGLRDLFSRAEPSVKNAFETFMAEWKDAVGGSGSSAK